MQPGKKLKVTASLTTVFFPFIKRFNFERNNTQAIWRTNFVNVLRKQFLALGSDKSNTVLITLEVVGNLMRLPSCHLFQNRTGEGDLFKKRVKYQEKEIDPVSTSFTNSGK